MKVVHVLKRIEMIDDDIKELKKLEKSIVRNKSFTTPIYMSIEKQINILLGERIKMLELTIANPPDSLVEEIEGKKPEKKVISKKPKAKSKKAKTPDKDIDDEDDIPMLTQDLIDSKISDIKSEKDEKKPKKKAALEKVETEEEDELVAGDEGVKLLDIALEKGSLSKKEIEKEKKVKFFRENFPID